MGKAGILPIGYPPLLWSTGTLQPPPKRTFPAPICDMISVVDTSSLSQTPTTSQSRGKARSSTRVLTASHAA